jgi:hypothetical protein
VAAYFVSAKLCEAIPRRFATIRSTTAYSPVKRRAQSKTNVAALELKRHLGVCDKTAVLMEHKLMEVTRGRADACELDGRVEIDGAYLGG